ncbi:MAG: efflux RND transporter periplasmic adaptor subunit [Acidobacteriia bacterium]|nr:efflux RND transporter periplasmic adaptor subunit [Terriglobia bacterium]
MKLWKKISIGIGAAVVVAGIVIGSIKATDKGAIAVQMGKVVREDLTSTVTASGQIKPKYYVNVSPFLIGRIDKLYVKEGDTVKEGQLLAQMESEQQSSNVHAMQAALKGSMSDAKSADASVQASGANLKTAEAALAKAQADFDRAKLDYNRTVGLQKDGIVSQQQLDLTKSTYEMSRAALEQAKAQLNASRSQLNQSVAQKNSVENRVAQTKANLAASTDLLGKTTFRATLPGIITNLPVHEGETVVSGIQNTSGSLIMTIADMSIVTAEVLVDETDIVNVAMGQPTDVSVDAIPNETFKGHVTEIGNSALTKSGLSATQTSGNQEAKDFKVVVTIDNPPASLRPGLSCTAHITTASKKNVLAVPIQAITIRDLNDVREQERKKSKGSGSGVAQAATKDSGNPSGTNAKKKKDEVQGVFVIDKNNVASFRQVDTGIAGQTDIEIKTGLQEGERIVTGNYKTLRTIKTLTPVKEEKKVEKKDESTST